MYRLHHLMAVLWDVSFISLITYCFSFLSSSSPFLFEQVRQEGPFLARSSVTDTKPQAETAD